MSLQGKPLISLGLSDLQRLIDNQVAESLSIEYKLQEDLKRDKDRRDFLADVSAFGNSQGGDLLIGVRAEEGIPVELIGVPKEEIDGRKLAINSLIQDGLQQRMYVEVHEIPINAERSVLLLRIPRSWLGPHRVTFQNHGHFYGRNSAGSYQMDVNQLRSTFLYSSNISTELERRRKQRFDEILEEPMANPKVIVHLMPYSATDPSQMIDIGRAEAVCQSDFIPFGAKHPEQRSFNVDGLISRSEQSGMTGKIGESYIQLYRSGIIETVASGLMGGFITAEFDKSGPTVACERLLQDVHQTVTRGLTILRKLEIPSPIALMLSLQKVKGYEFPRGGTDDPHGMFYGTKSIDRVHVALPSIVIDSYERDLPGVTKPLFDALWNAGGWPRCFYYGDDGTLNLKF